MKEPVDSAKTKREWSLFAMTFLGGGSVDRWRAQIYRKGFRSSLSICASDGRGFGQPDHPQCYPQRAAGDFRIAVDNLSGFLACQQSLQLGEDVNGGGVLTIRQGEII